MTRDDGSSESSRESLRTIFTALTAAMLPAVKFAPSWL
jgi:hypothetical protein